MKELLKELGFKEIEQDGVNGWSKPYRGFILFIGKVIVREEYLAAITVGRNIEISMPLPVDILWVREFDTQN